MSRINFETFFISYLKGKGFDVFADVPDGKLVTKPEQFVTVELIDSTTDGVAVGYATLAVQSWAQTRYASSELANQVDEAVFEIVNNTNPITHINRQSLTNYPTAKEEPRYQATYEVFGHINN